MKRHSHRESEPPAIEALELLAAFRNIQNPILRQSVISLARALRGPDVSSAPLKGFPRR